MNKIIKYLSLSVLCLAITSDIVAKNQKRSRQEILEDISGTALPGSQDNSYISSFAGSSEFGTESKIAIKKPKDVKNKLNDIKSRLDQIRHDIQQIYDKIQ